MNTDQSQFTGKTTTRFGWIIGVMLLSVFIGFLTMPAMSIGLRRDLFFFERAYQIGLIVTVATAAFLFIAQRFQFRLLFLLELMIALSIVAYYYVSYNESRSYMLDIRQQLEQTQRDLANENQP